MRIQTFILGLSCLLINFGASAQLIKDVEGNGEVVSATKKVDHFTEVQIPSSCDVTYVQGGNGLRTVWIEAESNIIDMVQVSVKKSILKIEFNTPLNLGTHKNIRIKISSDALYVVKNAGNSSFTVKGKLQTPNLELYVSGEGIINIPNVETEKISATIYNKNGAIILGGKTKEAHFGIQMGGEIQAKSLQAETVKNLIKMGGTIKCSASKYLKNTFWGGGEVYYWGDAELTRGGLGNGKVIQVVKDKKE